MQKEKNIMYKIFINLRNKPLALQNAQSATWK
jgi:hypothetical protein